MTTKQTLEIACSFVAGVLVTSSYFIRLNNHEMASRNLIFVSMGMVFVLVALWFLVDLHTNTDIDLTGMVE